VEGEDEMVIHSTAINWFNVSILSENKAWRERAVKREKERHKL
jgi:hypothetical protein